MCRRSWKWRSGRPAFSRALLQTDSWKFERRSWPPFGPTKTNPRSPGSANRSRCHRIPPGTAPERDEGDGSAPADPDDGLRRFVKAVTADDARDRDGGWLGGLREYVPNSGPVPGSRLV